ncbi:ABC transporter permease subunit [Agriterribacter sp.]|uniref:ABC transporter permease n=1 Tax=Agriterribacter sp. TaxID=2821509 RepID=UPI002C917E99|nr:ABC transporter permease subunit [Agriterribacter sp.]HRO47879.1 ABC transporter permease subunit [Agriterribacter sp.]HRQ18825.1 ABC transporter permease subunit [Agriterribacter sp.]
MESPLVYFKGLFSKGITHNSLQQQSESPFRVMVRKETGDHIRSWRFIVMLTLIALIFLGSIYVSLSNISKAVANIKDPDRIFVYLKLLTTSDGTLPTFHIFISFLGPLLGIALGFDAVNAEQNNGTLTRLMAQPVYRDNLLLAKFCGALIVVSILFLCLALLMTGVGMIITGVLPEPVELLRILWFVALSILYVGFWLSLSILLSVRFRNAATAALTGIGIWLFFTVFYRIIVNLVVNAMLPGPDYLRPEDLLSYNNLLLSLLRLAPSQLYTDAATTLLMPSVRSLGPLTMEQMAGAIPSPLPLKESLMIVWPQVTGLLAATMVCFALTYYLFMRREIRT